MVALAKETQQVASDLEAASASNRSISTWLRARLLLVLDDAVRLGPAASESSVELLVQDAGDAKLAACIAARLKEFEDMFALRSELLASGLTASELPTATPGWQAALAKLEDELVLLWGARFRYAAVAVLQSANQRPLSEVLDALTSVFEELDAAEKRCEALGRKSQLKSRVVGPRLQPVVRRAVSLVNLDDRQAALEELRSMFQRLSRPEIADIVSSDHLVSWLAPLLLEGERTKPFSALVKVANQQAYRAALGREHRLSILTLLVEVAILGVEKHVDKPGDPDALALAVSAVLLALPAEVQDEIVRCDLERIERRLGYLKSWWLALTPLKGLSAQEMIGVLEVVARSGLLRILRGDGEPMRLAVEARRVGEVFPGASERVHGLQNDIEAFDRETREALVALLEGHADHAWRSALSD